jgi:hypothetical protein
VKKKYFAVQKGAPASAAYSSQDVKRRRLNEEHSMREAARAKLERRRIRRSQILEHPLSGGFLSREQGQTRDLAASDIFSLGLVTSTEIRGPNQLRTINNPLFEFKRRKDLGPSIVDFQVGMFNFLRFVGWCSE